MLFKICLYSGFFLSVIAILGKNETVATNTRAEEFHTSDLFHHVYDLWRNIIESRFGQIYQSAQSFLLGRYLPINDQQQGQHVLFLKKLRVQIIVEYIERSSFEAGPNDVRDIDERIQSPNDDTDFSLSSQFSNGANTSELDVYESELEQDKQCGELRVRIKRIIGGRDSSFGHRPWQVGLLKPTSRKPYCGGALITDKWIITAAHCVNRMSTKFLTVRLGEVHAQRKSEELRDKEYRVTEKEVHPRYSTKRHQYDIALLKLAKTVYFDRNIVPVCLPKPDLDLIGRRATVSGWGDRKVNDKKSRPAILNEVDVEVIPNHVCQKWFLEAGHARTISDVFLCAGHGNGGRDSCKGDSGGPLTTSVNGKEILIGIVSWGFGCGEKHSPGVYTNIKKFVPWIRGLIGGINRQPYKTRRNESSSSSIYY